LASAELYDPATGSWTATGNLHITGRWHTDSVLSDGRILVTGGQDWVSGQRRDGIGGPVRPHDRNLDRHSAMAEARSYHTATLLPDRRVLVVGGQASVLTGEQSVLSSAELYDAGSGS
jgi:hypothetical protein